MDVVLLLISFLVPFSEENTPHGPQRCPITGTRICDLIQQQDIPALQERECLETIVFMKREKEFEEFLDNLLDIAHNDAFQFIKIEEDKVFLMRQREPGRVGYLGGTDKKLSGKEEKVLEKKEIEEKRREKNQFLASPSSAVSYVPSSDESIKELFTSDESNDSDVSCQFPENTQNQGILKRGTKNFITPKSIHY
ncbi:hypothetical protein AVEN_68778-1 [Araneus ventricosus]|uniref:Uncharacterized protein n=1 Tax=Araneus ventricosus TaxID=182803 RepID=A0A4Y2C4V3_ARAVE|nr:hypothetical protein AVEN_68778-1 [Araneus ventricosus]